MLRLVATVSFSAMLAGCSAPQPFDWGLTDAVDETESTLDPQDPNTSVDSKFAYDYENGLTLNSVEYDAEKNDLIINNLPFDGPKGRYDFMATLGDVRVFKSRKTATTGRVQSYAVFVESSHIQGAAAAGAEWNGGYGYGGANINRDEFSLPEDGEYVYIGDYAAVRTFDDRAGLELVSGDLRLILDVNDFDPVDGIQGAITGSVYNRVRYNENGNRTGSLSPIALRVTQFSTDEGVFDGGTAATYFSTGDEDASGTFEGFLAGENGTDIGGNVVIEGAAYSELVSYEVVTYSVTTTTDAVVFEGIEITPEITTTKTETVNSLKAGDRVAAQNTINAGGSIGDFSVDTSTFPDGYVIEDRYFGEELFVSEQNAREIGVLVGER